jgi:thioredoxin reductase (NADPH)
MNPYDVIIVGGGPAGLAAGIYARRAKLSSLLLEKTILGGQVAMADLIENYPGISEIRGYELSNRFREQAEKFGLEIRYTEVTGIRPESDLRIVLTSEGEYQGKAIIIASGAEPAQLNVKGEKEFVGKGISYCATCDGPFFTGKHVIVVGGGDSAVTEALFLSKVASKVHVVHRRDKLRAEKFNEEKARADPKIDFIWNSIVQEILGADHVESVVLKDVKTGQIRKVKTEGVFIYVGRKPNTRFVDVEKDSTGYIKTDDSCGTSVKGIFAAGDCTSPLWKQIVTAVGEGAKAAMSAQKHLEGLT